MVERKKSVHRTEHVIVFQAPMSKSLKKNLDVQMEQLIITMLLSLDPAIIWNQSWNFLFLSIYNVKHGPENYLQNTFSKVLVNCNDSDFEFFCSLQRRVRQLD